MSQIAQNIWTVQCSFIKQCHHTLHIWFKAPWKIIYLKVAPVQDLLRPNYVLILELLSPAASLGYFLSKTISFFSGLFRRCIITQVGVSLQTQHREVRKAPRSSCLEYLQGLLQGLLLHIHVSLMRNRLRFVQGCMGCNKVG